MVKTTDQCHIEIFKDSLEATVQAFRKHGENEEICKWDTSDLAEDSGLSENN